MNIQQAIKFNSFQVSELLDVLERFGIEADVANLSDASASSMFSELMIKAARSLDNEQAEGFQSAV